LVLAFRMPYLFLASVAQGLVFVFFMSMVGKGMPVARGDAPPAAGQSAQAVIFCVGIYMNAALLVALHVQDRSRIKQVLLSILVLLGAIVAGIWWREGFDAVVKVVSSNTFRVPFLPAALAGDVVFATTMHVPVGPQVTWLGGAFLLSMIPLFLGNSNWYEQSIVSTDRIATVRDAAKSGASAVLALRAANYKHKANKTYTVRPFGVGAGALAWAHVSAAAKRSFTNFIAPLSVGMIVGVVGVFAGLSTKNAGAGVALALMLYTTIGFMTAAKTASEAAIRRRELLAPLPIPGWQSVAANLVSPMISAVLLTIGFSMTYGVGGGPFLAETVFGALIVFSLRLAARMVLQYGIVLGYPDSADKLQQLVGHVVYTLLSVPLLIGEIIVCIPALLLQSVWLALGILAIYESALLGLLLFLTGKAAEKAIATGEPVSIFAGGKK
jgi:hypothetical protein